MRLFRPKPVVEFKRKCSDCGHSWYVTAQERRIPPPVSPQIPGLMHSVGARVQLGLGKRRAVAAARELEHLESQRWKFEAERARAAQITSCSQCGSPTYTERRVVPEASSSPGPSGLPAVGIWSLRVWQAFERLMQKLRWMDKLPPLP